MFIFALMPLDRLVIPQPGIKVGFWKITESLDDLMQMYNGNSMDEHLGQMNETRQVHALSSRLLAQHFYPDEPIQKDAWGKPALIHSKHHISWSHSGNYAAFISSEHEPAGIDIETVSNRIRRIEEKFCNNEDKKCVHRTYHSESLLLIWAAKESLYKLYGKKEVDFKKDMTVALPEISHEGRFEASFHKAGEHNKYLMEYEFFDGHVAVWTLGRLIASAE